MSRVGCRDPRLIRRPAHPYRHARRRHLYRRILATRHPGTCHPHNGRRQHLRHHPAPRGIPLNVADLHCRRERGVGPCSSRMVVEKSICAPVSRRAEEWPKTLGHSTRRSESWCGARISKIATVWTSPLCGVVGGNRTRLPDPPPPTHSAESGTECRRNHTGDITGSVDEKVRRTQDLRIATMRNHEHRERRQRYAGRNDLGARRRRPDDIPGRSERFAVRTRQGACNRNARAVVARRPSRRPRLLG